MFELILVLALVGLSAALVAPALMGFSRQREALDATADMLALTRYAQAQAIRDGVPHRLHVDVERGTYWLTAQRGSAFVPLGTSLGRTIALPEHVTVVWASSSDEHEGYVQFEPDGSHQPATLLVADARGVVARLSGEFPTEPFRVLDPATDREVVR